MILTCNYNSLISATQSIASIVEDALSSDDDKAVIFNLKSSGVTLIGTTPVITYKRSLADCQLVLDEGDMMFMLKTKDLMPFLNTFKSLRRTKVDRVVFETLSNRIRCTIFEVYNEDVGYSDELHSSWVFDNIPIKPKKLPYINLESPTEQLFDCSMELKLLSESMIPVVGNTSNIYGNLVFSEEHIVAFNQAFTSISKNFLAPKGLSGIKLNYRVLAFIKKVLLSEEQVSVSKTDRHLYFTAGGVEAFVMYDTKLASYDTQLGLHDATRHIAIDRGYLKDVLRRFSLASEPVEFTVNPDSTVLHLKNSKFEQEIPILDIKGFDGVSQFKFKVMPLYLDSAMLGEDSTFLQDGNEQSGNIFLYYNQAKSIISLGDCTNLWFSVLSVTVYE